MLTKISINGSREAIRCKIYANAHKSVIVADRAYEDFGMLFQWNKDDIYFVLMLKDQIKYELIKELPLPENKDEHILKDEIIKLITTDRKTL